MLIYVVLFGNYSIIIEISIIALTMIVSTSAISLIVIKHNRIVSSC